MIFGGLLKTSLIDYPGMVACAVFTSGCNFCCPYCHNPDLATVDSPSPGTGPGYDGIMTFLEKRKGLLDGVVITGGEPTLQPGLLEFCLQVRSMGYKVKLDTNGSRPGTVKDLLEKGVVDYVAMDIKTSLDRYATLAAKGLNPASILESIGIIMTDAPEYEFRSTCVRGFVDRETLPAIGNMIQGASRYFLQECSDRGRLLNPGVIDVPGDFLSRDEIQELKHLAAPWVGHCSVR